MRYPQTPDQYTVLVRQLEQDFNTLKGDGQANITAHAGGGQASATLISANICKIVTCATSGDSVKVPFATKGDERTLINSGVASCQVFGTDADTINGVASGTGYAIPAGKTALMTCAADGAWDMLVLPPGASAGTGTVTSVAATAPAAGFTIAGSPITTSGTFTFTLANDLGALEALSSTGFAARTTTDTWAQRTITGTSNRISVSNGDGVSGNPTIDLALKRGAGCFVETPSAKTYTIVGYAPSAGTVNGAWVKSSAGTLTANFQINGSSITSISALSVSSTGARTAATGANTFVAGDRITVVVTSPSSAADFEAALDVT